MNKRNITIGLVGIIAMLMVVGLTARDALLFLPLSFIFLFLFGYSLVRLLNLELDTIGTISTSLLFSLALIPLVQGYAALLGKYVPVWIFAILTFILVISAFLRQRKPRKRPRRR